MPKILITEQSRPAENQYIVNINFNDAEEFEDIKVQNPFTPENEAKLEWHFESYVSFPFLEEVEPREAQKIIKEAGENLFSQLFGQPLIYSRYYQILNNDFNNLVIEISGSPEFHSLHWEALKDPNLPAAFALDLPIIRKDKNVQTFQAFSRETSTINLLLVTSRPRGRKDVSYRTISRPLVELIRNSHLPVMIDILRPGTYESLSKHLDQTTAKYGNGFYHVVHFDAHGALLTFEDFKSIEVERTGIKKSEKEKKNSDLIFRINSLERYGRANLLEPFPDKQAFLFFDYYRDPVSKDDDGFRADPVKADELANLLIRHGVPLIILNACQSAKELGEQKHTSGLPVAEGTSLASRLVRAGAQMVLAMSYSVTVTAAEILMKSLYQEIFGGKTLNRAIQTGRKELASQKERRAAWNYQVSLEDWLLPVVYQKQNVELRTAKLTAREEEKFNLAQQEISRMPEVTYGFYGRDIDILNVERRVLLKNNILLIRGMGGAGKTTLLQHLSWWWQATNFVQKVFYFGFDEKAYTMQKIIREIAKKLYDRFEFKEFQAMDEIAQQQKLAKKLRTERHLLILDNLESIQGGYFAVKNMLSAKEQAKLKAFLAELRGDIDQQRKTLNPFQEQTIVLLGSRSPEDWLADATFKKNVYHLGGLDAESTTQFAEEILRQNEVLHYRNEEDFKKLLKLLAGFPLPMKVVLGNLKLQTPSEILAALKAADVVIDAGTTEKRTENILKCIEYSHSNIAPEKQELLLCLAPFTSIVNRAYFPLYIEELKKHEALAHLKHDLWDEVFAESIQRGLVSQKEEMPFIQLQPILPYFLKTEWQKTERADFKHAIQTAFRNYYDHFSNWIRGLINSQKASEKLKGQMIANLEFENIDTCLNYSLKSKTSFENSYFALSNYFTSINNYQSALNLGEIVFNQIKNYFPEDLTGDLGLEFTGILESIGVFHMNLKHYSEASDSFLKVLQLRNDNKTFNKEEVRSLNASVYHNLGIVSQEQRRWEEAEDYFFKAVDLLNEFNEKNGLSKTYLHLGIVAFEQRQLEKAEKYFLKSLQTRIESDDLKSQSLPLYELGIVATEQKDWQKAESYLKQALYIFSKFNDEHMQAMALRQLGIVSFEQHKWQESENYYLKAIEICISINDYFTQAMTFHELGFLAQAQTNWKKAESYYQQSIKIKRKLQNYHSLALTLMNLGLVKEHQGKLDESRQIYLQTLEIYINYNDPNYIFYNLSRLRDLWRSSGDNHLLFEVGEVLKMSDTDVQELFKKLSDESLSEDGNIE